MHVVIAGGGVAALETAIALRDLAAERVSITMLAPEDDFVFKPLSVGEPFALGDAQRVPLKKLARDLGIDLVQDGLASVSPGSHLVLKITDDYRLNTALTYADSCAPAGHPLMRRFWTTRFFLSNVVVALGEKDRLLGLAGALEQLRPRVRDFAYRVRDTLRSRLRRRAQR